MKKKHCSVGSCSLLLGILLFVLVPAPLAGQQYEASWESLNSRPVPQWFGDAKFGIFIHWGLYSVPAWAPANADIGVYAKYAEWYWYRIHDDSEAGKLFRAYHNNTYGADFKYQDFAADFKAEHFDPAQWAELFGKAGAKYVVLTSKHHEGFTLWPSEQSWNWNSMDLGPHRDLCGELSTAVKAAGLHMGFYYSLYEWFNPLYKKHPGKYVDEHMIPQMKDLVLRYEPDVLWTDGEWDHPSETWKSTEFLSWLYNESPVKDRVCVNDRWGSETRGKHGGYFTTEYGLVHHEEGVNLQQKPWEECRGIGTSFGYNRIETPENYSSTEQLLELLIQTVAAGGNLLLDVGPTADGRIPALMQQRLLDLGAWLQVNGEAIYETITWEGATKTKDVASVYYTRKGNDLYLLTTQWPEQALSVEGIKRPEKVQLLGFSGTVKTSFKGAKLSIQPPAVSPPTFNVSGAWVFKLAGAL
ncbi:MAG: alpha-L-fucosidase [Prolixibacteraceae bacterium]|nr:alpha-L-fucosidase [Prolixibacteraceae bacterium]